MVLGCLKIVTGNPVFAHDSIHTLFDEVYPFFIKSPPAFQA